MHKVLNDELSYFVINHGSAYQVTLNTEHDRVSIQGSTVFATATINMTTIEFMELFQEVVDYLKGLPNDCTP